MLKRLIIFLGFYLLACGAYAQSYRFKHITSEEGLSTNYVTSILQDEKGFMWFGTQDGLCRYDGYQIKVFKSDDGTPESLPSSYVTSLYQHSDKFIYIGTKNDGLCLYNPVTDKFQRIPVKGEEGKTLSDYQVNCFFKENEDEVWIGTSNGINLFNVKTQINKKIFFPIEKPVDVACIYRSGKNVLIGTRGDGLWMLDAGYKPVLVELENNIIGAKKQNELKVINAISEYAGNLYLATYGSGVVMVDENTMSIEKVFKASSENNNYNYVENFRIENNSLFTITRDGFVIFDLISGESERLIKNEKDASSINDDYLTSIYIDKEKNIWLGSFSGGINVSFSQTLKFPNLPKEISEQFKNAFSVHDEGHDNVWIGGEKFLKKYNKVTHVLQDFSFLIDNNNHVLSINHDESGNIFAGTWGLGLIKYNLVTKKKEKYFDESLGGTIMSIAFDKHGNVWAGSYSEGLFIIEKSTNKIRHYSVEDGLSSDNIIAILKDAEGNIWLGTEGGGAVFVKAGEISKKENVVIYKPEEGKSFLNSGTVYSIAEDGNKNIWMATDAGFCKFEKDKKLFTTYSEKNGLANNSVFSMLADSLGNIWMSTNKGVSKFNPNTVNINGSAFRNYDQKDGLLNIEFTQGAYAKLSDGSMVFGGVNGVNIFHPKNIRDNFHVPPVYVVSYKRSGKDVPTDTTMEYKKYLKLSWRENFFQFELAALDYNSPGKNKYMYKLEGYDNDWSSPSNIRYVSYTELPGGDYVFKVKAANNDGVWNETPYAIYITVVPPFWKTTWFYILVSVFGLAGIIIFTQLRTRAIKKENKLLEAKVAERTKELAEKNRDITSSIEYANRIQEAILPSRAEIFAKFTDAFILYKPKDIVSGDFYWYGYKNNCKIFAVVDCTGHGVPGAFMSMIGHNILNQAVMEKGVTDPGEILTRLHQGVQLALKQGHNEIDTNDGMDVSVISVNEATGEIKWSGAFRPALIVKRNSELIKLTGNKFSVGGAQNDGDRIFISHPINLEKGDVMYLFSDGYADQFGGDHGKKFMLKKFQDLLCAIHLKEMNEQCNSLEQAFESWKSNREQVDDVLVVGIRF